MKSYKLVTSPNAYRYLKRIAHKFDSQLLALPDGDGIITGVLCVDDIHDFLEQHKCLCVYFSDEYNCLVLEKRTI